MKILFNNNISEVYVNEKRRLFHINYIIGNGKRKVSTKWGIFPKYEKCYGLFSRWGGEYWGDIEEYIKIYGDEYIEDGAFYRKPYCLIVSNSGEKNEVVFETVDELLSYVEELKNMGEHILIK
jgi:hypothetical protein